MRIKITPHDFIRYNASFYDDQCIECNSPIDEGDPIGFLTDKRARPDALRRSPPKEDRHGPLCDSCLIQLRTRAVIQVTHTD